MTVDDWVDLANLNVTFAVVRLINQDGSIDNAGIRNLRNALEANFTELSGYMYPCVQSSYFARVEGIECLDQAAQIDTLVASLEENVAKLENYTTVTWVPTSAPTGSPTIAAQPTYAPTSSPLSYSDHRFYSYAFIGAIRAA